MYTGKMGDMDEMGCLSICLFIVIYHSLLGVEMGSWQWRGDTRGAGYTGRIRWKDDGHVFATTAVTRRDATRRGVAVHTSQSTQSASQSANGELPDSEKSRDPRNRIKKPFLIAIPVRPTDRPLAVDNTTGRVRTL